MNNSDDYVNLFNYASLSSLIRKYYTLMNILKSLSVGQINIFCYPLSSPLSHIIPYLEKLAQLVRQPIDTIVDVETKGGGHSQSKMREDGESLHPGRPGYFLE